MMDYTPFIDQFSSDEQLTDTARAWIAALPGQIQHGLSEQRYGDLPRWKSALERLPDWPVADVALDRAEITVSGADTVDGEQRDLLKQTLQELHPWRKGPFRLFDVNIDTEWRSDWKWNRLIDHISPLQGRRVLDVGCGSGYHCWRMRGAGAELIVGIEPTPLFIVQFFALQKYIQDPRVAVLPMGIQHLPEKLQYFDSTFSMGVLYHRRSPFDHLLQLRDTLKPGGELILETLVIDGGEGEVLVPGERYARMGNVWFLPSCPTLTQWLKKVGFRDIRLLNVSTTTTEEQRQTEWMTFHSLQQFLDADDHSRTIEGYPAPRRAIFCAKAP